jgi:hypothetical protein
LWRSPDGSFFFLPMRSIFGGSGCNCKVSTPFILRRDIQKHSEKNNSAKIG